MPNGRRVEGDDASIWNPCGVRTESSRTPKASRAGALHSHYTLRNSTPDLLFPHLPNKSKRKLRAALDWDCLLGADMTPIEAARVAAAIAILRPEWPEPSLRTFLTDPKHHVARRPYQDVAAAMAWIATDPTTKTPARVLESGPWWHIGKPEPEPAKAAQCPRCRDFYDPREGHKACNRPSHDELKATAAEEAKEAVRLATADRCLHDVPRRLCLEHRESEAAS
jgi:hypothetical protein